jgi:hypothetical protein
VRFPFDFLVHAGADRVAERVVVVVKFVPEKVDSYFSLFKNDCHPKPDPICLLQKPTWNGITVARKKMEKKKRKKGLRNPDLISRLVSSSLCYVQQVSDYGSRGQFF